MSKLSLKGRDVCVKRWRVLVDGVGQRRSCFHHVLSSFSVGCEHGQEAIESAAVFLFEIFYNKDHVGTEETRAIKHMFGPFPASGAETSCSSVSRLVASLGDGLVEDFIQSSHHTPQRGSTFGRNIAFSYECYSLDPLEDLSSSAVQEEKDSLDFMNFLNIQQSGRKGTEKEGTCSLNSGGENLLHSEVEKYLKGGSMMSSSPEELCTSLFEMLASQRSDDELQNEVCLGGEPTLSSLSARTLTFIRSPLGFILS